MLVDDAHDAWRQAAADVEKSLGVTVAVTPIGPGAVSPDEHPDWTGAVLIRPDAVVAWKPSAPADAAAGQLTDVMAGILSVGGR